MIKMRKNVEAGRTPEKITVSMIDQDLKDGISKPEMAIKYGIKPWEVDEMFKHPFLKGRRPSRKKALSFSFVDDITEDRIKETGTVIDKDIPGFEGTKEQLEEIDPNQITLQDAIDEVTKTTEEAVKEFAKAEKEITEILSPTEYETPEETIINANKDAEVKESWEEDRDDLDYANKELNEEELDQDEDDGTFEL